jgi:hypothetical protein
VRFGERRTFIADLALFTIADVLLLALALRGIVPLPPVVVPALYVLHVCWSWQTMRAGITFYSVRWLQVRYRIRYALIGLVMLLKGLSYKWD